MRQLLLAAWLLVLMVEMPVAAEEPAAELKAKTAIWVKDLGADSFETRHAAQAELLKVGLAAEDAVRAVADSPDVEVAGRARFILAEFAKRKIDAELEKVNWSTVLERVKKHAASDDWREPSFADPLIEKAVERLISQVNVVAKEDRVRMPVRFTEVRPIDPAAGFRPMRDGGQLLCAQGYQELGHCQRAIILVDGSVRISFATNCLIIARGAVNIAHSNGNVILAGQFIDISHDGTALRRPDGRGADGTVGSSSLAMSGSVLRFSSAARAVCSAPDEARVGFNDCVLINSPALPDLPVAPVRPGTVLTQVHNGVKLLLQPVAPPNPIRDQLKITEVVQTDSRRGHVIVEQNGVEIVMRPGAEIKDNLGKPIANLSGWKLAFVADGYALFSNGKEDASFVIPRGR